MDVSAEEYRTQRLADGTACLEAALEYLAFGWSVLALCTPDHVGMGKAHSDRCGSPGKAPWHTWKELQDRLPTEEEVRDRWRKNPWSNVGCALGPVSEMIRVDVEGQFGEARLLELSGGDLPDTLEFASGRENGGRGLLYGIPKGAKLRTTAQPLAVGEELRLQAKGAQTVLPPSKHESGRYYAWKDGHAPGQMQLAPAPAWLLEQLSEDRPGGRRKQTFVAGEIIPEGARDETMASFAGSMRRRGMSEEAMYAALLVENQERCDPPLAEADIRRIAHSIARYDPEPDVRAMPKPSRNGTTADDELEGDATAADLIRINATIRWIWDGWIPVGVLTILASEPGCGKTRFCADLLRRVYLGLPWPDGSPPTFPPGTVALWVASDNQHPELASIPEQFGFPPEALFLNTSRSAPFGGTMLDDEEDLKAFERRIERVKPSLTFVDTCLNATEKSSHKPEDARAFFGPLQQIAARTASPIVCVTHLNAAGKPLGRRIEGQGRVVMMLEKPDPDGQPHRRKLYVRKSNSLYPDPLGITMSGGGNEYDRNPPRAPDVVEGGPQKISATDRCMEIITNMLIKGPAMMGIVRETCLEQGFSIGTFQKAKAILKLSEYKAEGRMWLELPS
jgi:hypothetical protein